jgi:hypothetical protein
MKLPNDSERVTRQEFTNAFMRVLASNRFIFGYLGSSLIVALVLGLGAWTIMLGIFVSFVTLAQMYDPAYRLFVSLFRFTGLPSHVPRPPLWLVINFVFSLAISALFIFIGVKIIQQMGLCDQNVSCVIGRFLWQTMAQ